jgi:hypothetical protein
MALSVIGLLPLVDPPLVETVWMLASLVIVKGIFSCLK